MKASRTRKLPIRSKNRSAAPQAVSRIIRVDNQTSAKTKAMTSRNLNARGPKQRSSVGSVSSVSHATV